MTTDGCTRYYNVKSRDTCTTVAQKNGIATWTDLRMWNSGLSADCSNLFLGQTYCVAGPTGSPHTTATVGPGLEITSSPARTSTMARPTTTSSRVVATSTTSTNNPAPTSAPPSNPLINGQATCECLPIILTRTRTEIRRQITILG